MMTVAIKSKEQQQYILFITFIITNMAMLVLLTIIIVMVTKAKHAAGIPCQAYHAGRPAKERSQVLEDWNEGRVPVVAATIAFGMGIDRASKYHRSLLHWPAVGFQLWLGTESGDCKQSAGLHMPTAVIGQELIQLGHSPFVIAARHTLVASKWMLATRHQWLDQMPHASLAAVRQSLFCCNASGRGWSILKGPALTCSLCSSD